MRYNQPLPDSDFNTVPTKNIDLNVIEETDLSTNEATNMLANTSSENLDYINSLLKECKTASNNQRGHSGLKGRGHQRTRSTLMELSHEHKSKQIHNESSFQNHPSLQTICGTTQASSMKRDLITEEENFRIKFDRGSPRNNMSHGGPHNTPTGKSGKLFDQFFKKDDLMRRSMSMEDLRFDRRIDRNLGHTSRGKKFIKEKGVVNVFRWTRSLGEEVEYKRERESNCEY